MNDASSVRRSMNRDLHDKNSVLANSKNSTKKVAVYVRKNKQKDYTFANVISTKENVIDVDVANASKAKNLLCVSCMKNVLILCHDKCLVHHRLNASRTLTTKSRTPKSLDTTYVVLKTSQIAHFVQMLFLLVLQVVQIVLWIIDGGDDLLTGGRKSNLDTISVSDMAASSPVCLMSKATSTKSWLWHHRLSHLNFGTINDLTRIDLVIVLPKLQYEKDHICSACERGKSKKASHPPKLVPINGVVERRNRTLVEVASIMLIFSRLPEFLWAEAVATAYFTQNRSFIYTRYNKTPYELLRDRNLNVEYFHVFGSLCYPTNDCDDLGKMKPKVDIGVFIGYSKTSRRFRIYNRRTKKIMETIHVKFDELMAMAFEHDCLEPELQRFNYINSSTEPMSTPSKEDLDNLFCPMFEEYFGKKSSDTSINSHAQLTQLHEDLPSTSSINIEEHEAPPIETTSDEQTSLISLTKADELHQEDSADFDGNSQFVSYN
uniref:Retrovirus-related Pol polyprotein from transposon TNT 1-94 n=1 Tax=Tanacetum cinerariifolium TaxID=118510 RepID=A0A699JX12_TANCI|nr:retrovirus-related Pol polyprotein from transposon TNT 1-94 [Tanacetum cinerariifolium]